MISDYIQYNYILEIYCRPGFCKITAVKKDSESTDKCIIAKGKTLMQSIKNLETQIGN